MTDCVVADPTARAFTAMRRRLLLGVAAMVPIVLAPSRGDGDTRPKADTMPAITWSPGDSYFRCDGRQAFLLGRNLTGWRLDQFQRLLRWSRADGERMVRIQLTTGMPPSSAAGEVDEAWAARWEKVFAMAAENGIWVLPVFGVWADWNDGSGGEKWHAWRRNPYNSANGGPATGPSELFGESPCRHLWLGWLVKLVGRWQALPNILGWEVFSELDLVTGVTPSAAGEFVEQAAAAIRRADGAGRPVTVSLAGVREWPQLFRSDAVDLLQVHPYANHPRFHGDLAGLILWSVRRRLERYGKPVLIGECGLDSRGIRDTIVASPRARVGIRHAIWAGVVSGAMNGRMLWWEDGYDQYQRLDLHLRYKDAAEPVSKFAAQVDFAGLRPMAAACADEIDGAVLGRQDTCIGWFRDAQCLPPQWTLRRLSDCAVTLAVQPADARWRVQFVDTKSGNVIGASEVTARRGRLRIVLRPFEGSLALIARRAGR